MMKSHVIKKLVNVVVVTLIMSGFIGSAQAINLLATSLNTDKNASQASMHIVNSDAQQHFHVHDFGMSDQEYDGGCKNKCSDCSHCSLAIPLNSTDQKSVSSMSLPFYSENTPDLVIDTPFFPPRSS